MNHSEPWPERSWQLHRRSDELGTARLQSAGTGVRAVAMASLLAQRVAAQAGAVYETPLAARNALASLVAAGYWVAGAKRAGGSAQPDRLEAIEQLANGIEAMVVTAAQMDQTAATLIREHRALVAETVQLARHFARTLAPALPRQAAERTRPSPYPSESAADASPERKPD